MVNKSYASLVVKRQKDTGIFLEHQNELIKVVFVKIIAFESTFYKLSEMERNGTNLFLPFDHIKKQQSMRKQP